METLLSIALALLAGLLMSRVIKPLKLPAVTGYLIAGLLVGPSVLGTIGIDGIGFIDFDKVSALNPISDVALGFIAFAIGNEFRIKQLKTIGRQATVIAVFQAISATVLVDLGLLGLHLLMPDKINVSDCIILGAIATATAPAATLMVVNQYKAKGPLVDILLPIVALDDAVGLVVFAVSFGIAKSLLSSVGVSLVSVLLNPMLEVTASLLLGTLLGLIYTWLERFFNSRSKQLCLTVTFVIFAVALSMLHIDFEGSDVEIGFSPLLVCMMMSTIFCNICSTSEDLMAKTDQWTAPLFVLFFVISGAELDLTVFTDLVAVLVGVAYIVLRSIGKMGGASLSSKLTHCDPMIQKWLGITLLPQAGVALGMSQTVSTQLGPDGAAIRSIVLFSVLIYELVGPMLTKIALTKAGEISPKELNPPHPKQKSHRAKA